MTLNSAPSSSERGPVTREEVVASLQAFTKGEGSLDAAKQQFLAWCLEQEKSVRNSLDTLKFEVSKAELLLEAGWFAEAADIIYPIYDNAGEELSADPALKDRVQVVVTSLDIAVQD